MFSQHTLKPYHKKAKRRLWRGNSAGQGTYCGRGMKGQNARSGVRPGFEGGQTPLLIRLPKLRGFKNPNRIENQVVAVSSLNQFADGDTVTKDMMKKAGLIGSNTLPVKILASGTLTKKLTIQAEYASASALELLTASGSTISAKI